MSEYKRFIAYFYEYIDGKRQRNAGFAKVELRNGMWRLLFRINTGILLEQPIQVYGFVRMDKLLLGVPMGRIHPDRQNMQDWAYRANTPIGESGYGLEDLSGIHIMDGSGRSFWTVWDDEQLQPEQFVLKLPEEERQELGEQQEAEQSAVGRQEAAPLAAEWQEAEPLVRERQEAALSAGERQEAALSAGERQEAEQSAGERQEAAPSATERQEAALSAGERQEAEPLARERQEAEPLARERQEAAPPAVEQQEAALSAVGQQEAALSAGERQEAEQSAGGRQKAEQSAGEQQEAVLSARERQKAAPPAVEWQKAGQSAGRQQEAAPSATERQEAGQPVAEQQEKRLDSEQLPVRQSETVEPARAPSAAKQVYREMVSGEAAEEDGLEEEQILSETGPELEAGQKEIIENTEPELIEAELEDEMRAEAVMPAGQEEQDSESVREEQSGEVMQESIAGEQREAHMQEGMPEEQGVGPMQDAMSELFQIRTHVQPFADTELTDCVMILPCDITRLQQEKWQVGRSSFLQHGFYQYRHLLLGVMEDGEYVLGVPGIQNSQEQYMARMFGFEHFKPSKRLECGKLFGYWCSNLRKCNSQNV